LFTVQQVAGTLLCSPSTKFEGLLNLLPHALHS
jgi:hypothetical protein